MFEVIIIIGFVGVLVYLFNSSKKRKYNNNNNHKDDVIHNLCY